MIKHNIFALKHTVFLSNSYYFDKIAKNWPQILKIVKVASEFICLVMYWYFDPDHDLMKNPV